MITEQQLQSIMPGLRPQRNREYLPFLQAAMTEFAIASAARMAAFLAQLAHESGQLRYMEEIWGPTAAQGRYEPPNKLAATLGNTETGDGFRFKGRGPIQITGRSNYRRFGDLLSIDLITDPARAALPEVAFRIAALFWSKKGLNELADNGSSDAYREITRRINGGFNGLAEREKFYASARTVLAVESAPTTRGTRGGPTVVVLDDPDFDRGYESIRSMLEEEPAASVDSKPRAKARPRAATKSRPAVKAKPTKKSATRKKATGTTARRKRTASSKAKPKRTASSKSLRRRR